jgi:hypothetical protein
MPEKFRIFSTDGWVRAYGSDCDFTLTASGAVETRVENVPIEVLSPNYWNYIQLEQPTTVTVNSPTVIRPAENASG